MIVRLAPEAEADLHAIANQIALDNPRRAGSFISELRGRCAGLASFPERYPLLGGYEAQGVRHLVHARYLILYEVSGGAVNVLRIVHGHRDLSDMSSLY